MAIDCRQLLSCSHLHLLVWDRLDPAAHSAGLRFTVELLTAPGLTDKVMPLLRPLGRNESDYNAFGLVFAEHTGSLLGSPKDWRSRCCELWVQVGEAAEARAWQAIQDWLRTRPRAKGWRSHCQALWQPFSAAHDECKYAETGQAPRHRRYGEAEQFLRSLPQDERAYFLKVLWYRASEAFARESANGDLVCDIDPREEVGLARLRRFASAALDEFAPADYGIAHASGRVDPCAFSAAHLPAYAVNALTRVHRGRYWIEDHLGGDAATHPCCFSSRSDYLRLFGP